MIKNIKTVALYLIRTGSFDSLSELGGGFDFRYFSGSTKIVWQLFSSLTSSHSLIKEIIHQQARWSF